jgi:hypothetical protein
MTLTPERIEEIRANKAWQSPSLAELDALLDVWVAAKAMRENFGGPDEEEYDEKLGRALGGGR